MIKLNNLFLLSISVLLTTACGVSSAAEPIGEAAQEAFQEAVDEAPPPAPFEPEELSIEDSESCLWGTWVANPQNIDDYLSQAMNVSEEVIFNIDVISGNMLWSFDHDGNLFMDSEEPMDITVEIIANEVRLGNSSISIIVFGEADYVTIGNVLGTAGIDYEISGNADLALDVSSLLTSSATLSLTPGHFSGTAESLGSQVDFQSAGIAPEDYGGWATYQCDEETFILQFGDFNPIGFTKVKELGQ